MSAAVEGPELYEIPEGEARERFTVDGVGKAAWAMEHARRLARRQQEIESAAQNMIETWQSWAADEIEKLQGDRKFFEGLLERYALAQREADPKKKSVTTPFGVVETRGTVATWKFGEPEAFLAWAKRERPELVAVERTITEKPLLAEARKALELTDVGVIDPVTKELVPGVELVPESVRATVKPDLGGGV